MKNALDIDCDALWVLAEAESKTLGQALSELARKGLRPLQLQG